MTQKMKTLVEFIAKKHQNKSSQPKYHPKGLNELVQCIKTELEAGNYDLNCIDTSHVESMSDLFSQHNQADDMIIVLDQTAQESIDISKWDVSNVRRFDGMFFGCKWFNGDITNWDTSNATDMSYMFKRCTLFNQDISKWNVSNVDDMTSMFYAASNFNQDLSTWSKNIKITDKRAMYKMFLQSGLYENEPDWYKKNM